MTTLADPPRQDLPASGHAGGWTGSPLLRRTAVASVVAAQLLVLTILLLDPLPAPLRLATACLVGLAGGVAFAALLSETLIRPLRALRDAVEGDGRRLEGRKARETILRGFVARDDEIGRICAGLERTIRNLSDRAEACEAFASDLVHEIRNPLTSLKSAATSLGVVREPQRSELVAVIQKDVARLERLVSEMSRASRLEAELVREEAVRFDLREMMRALVAHAAAIASSKGVELIADLPPEPVMLSGREARLAQVLVNLLDNAVSFCEDGDAVRFWVRLRDDKVVIVVEDTGPGIPEGAAEKIFGRFYSQRPAEQFGENSGLGLAISRQIVEAHQGVIWAENIRPTSRDPLSNPSGARFVVVLPR